MALSMLAACNNDPAPTDTTTAGTTTGDIQSDTDGGTTAPTPEQIDGTVKADKLSAENVSSSDSFTFSQVYEEKETTLNADIKAGIRNVIQMNISYTSTFYGSEAAVKRDSQHLGDLYRSKDMLSEGYPENFFCGEFSGDRYSEIVTYENNILTILKMPKVSKPSSGPYETVYNATTAFSGRLCGTGDFDGNGFTDIMFYSENGRVIIAYNDGGVFTYKSAGIPKASFDLSAEMIACGDVNGDGVDDIIAVNGLKTASWLLDSDGYVTPFAEKTLNKTDAYTVWCIADINTDWISDLVVIITEGDTAYIRTYFGRGDGQFGPGENETENENLFPTYDTEGNIPSYITCGDINGDKNDDLVSIASKNGKAAKMQYFVYPEESPAYDYSSFIMKTENGYILYNGGMYCDYSDEVTKIDADHVLVYTSSDGRHFHRNLDSPAFYLGTELGDTTKWWSGNTIEPEVIYVNGTYYMYCQCENYTQKNGTTYGTDKIRVSTSTDGLHFTLASEEPVVKNAPELAAFTHEEMIYNAEDPDGKCFWMYVRYVNANNFQNFILIRSADPLSFDFNDMQGTSGFNQIGNQIGYCKLDNGKKVFFRITFNYLSDSDGYRTVPMMQYSVDGLSWNDTKMLLAGTDITDKYNKERQNCYFVGFSSINGTGEIERNADGSYTFLYACCTSNNSVAPDIFKSNIGLGTCTFTLEVIDLSN